MLRNTLNTVITATLIMLMGVSSSASAQTIVPAGDLMGKTSVTFSGKDPEVVRRSGVVNVPLAPSAPEIKHIEGDESGEWIIEAGQDTARSITYAVKATANGPDTYTLTAEYDEATSEDVGPPTLSISPDNPPLELGATAAIRIDDRTITVPYDKEGGLDSVNGISEGETVVIGGTSYPVASVTNSPNSEDPTAGYPTATILLGGADSAPDISLGTPITERRTFIVTVSDVELAGEAEGTAGIKITATSVKDGLKKSERSFKFVVLAPVEPSFEKYVRNVTAPVTIEAGEGETTVHEGSTFYSQGVSATEGDELEYLIVLNAGNQEDQTSIDLVETLSPFVKYVSEESASLNYQGESTPADIIAQSRAEVTLIRWMANVSTTSELPILKNTSAHLTYKVRVIGGVGSVEWAASRGVSYWGKPWGDGSAMHERDTPCWCDGEDAPVGYCTAVGWAAGWRPLIRNPGMTDEYNIREMADAAVSDITLETRYYDSVNDIMCR